MTARPVDGAHVMTWFRLYAEFATDPKVQMLSEVDQRRYIMVLCLRCSNGHVTLHETEMAFQLRISESEWQQTKATLLAKNLITADNLPTGWERRQYVSDSSVARVRKHREKVKRFGNVTVAPTKRPCNALETETETENKEQEHGARKRSPAFVPPTVEQVQQHCQAKGYRVDAEAFVAHYTANGWKVGGRAPMRDWRSATVTWHKRDLERRTPNGADRPSPAALRPL